MRLSTVAIIFCFSAFSLFRFAPQAYPQALAGAWVDEAEKRIEQHRKTDIRVLVLDAAGQPAPNAKVGLMQLRHEFAVGFVVPAAGWPEAFRLDRPVWRCFNTASLDRYTAWTTLESKPDRALETADAAAVMRTAEAHGMSIWWGGILSADAGRLPDHIIRADDDTLAVALSTQVDRVMGPYGRRVAAFDLYTHAMDHDMVEQRLGDAMLRRLFERADAISPAASLRVRMTDVLDRRRSQEAVRQVIAMNDAAIAIDALAIDQRFVGRVDPESVRIGLDRLAGANRPLIFSSLEVTGEQPLDTALSLETVLRCAFANPRVAGICLAGVTPDEAADDAFALIDAKGEPTAVGRVIDGLFWKHWRTNTALDADELGNVYARVFPGTYQMIATLPDGSVTASAVRVTREDGERLIMLQPNKQQPGGTGEDASDPTP